MRFFRAILIMSVFFINPVHAKVVIGTPMFDPPFILNEEVSLDGYDIELMRTVCTQLKWQCEFTPMHYVDLFASLQANKIDFIIGGIIITPEIKENYITSTPYLLSEGSFIAMKESGLHNIEDLTGKRVGAVESRPYIKYLLQMPNQITALPYNKTPDLALDLKNNKIDAAFVNYYTAHYLAHQYPDLIKALESKITVGEGLAIVALPTKQVEINQINKVLLQFEEDGTFVRLYNYYFQFFVKS